MTALWQAIDQYLAHRAPTPAQRDEVRRYRQRIHDILSSNFRLIAFFQSGSFQHGTAVMPHSDVDYMARFHFEDKPGSSTTILNSVRQALKDSLWEASDVFVARPTVTVKFSGMISSYEITPAYLVRGTDDGSRVVSIPASSGGWREAAPQAHNKFVSDMDRKHSGNIRTIARLLKAWKYEHDTPISSFYLEMRGAELGKNNESVWPLTAIKSIADTLIRTDLAAMNDPTGLVSRVSPCSSERDRSTALRHLRTLKANVDVAYSSWFAGESGRWAMNNALQDIWGRGFPYCDPRS